MSYDSSRATLIGPFDIAYNTAGITAGFVAVSGVLPVGTDVIKAWAEVTTQWNSATSAELKLGVAKVGALATVVDLVAYDAKTATAPTTNARVEPVPATGGSKAATVLEASYLAAKITEVGAATAGVAKVFALIVTPDAAGA